MDSLNASAGGLARRPKVTIAIPTFNRAAWIKAAVTRALAQSWTDFEVLVSDNASSDETQAVLAQFDDPRLRVVRHASNLGLVGNWNYCLAEARGEYFALVPDDDSIAPWFVERCIGLLDTDPQLPIILALTDFSSDGGRLFRASPNDTFTTGIWNGADLLGEFLEGRLPVQMCSVLVRADHLRSQGGFNEGAPYSTDICAWAPVVLRHRVGLVNESCATYNAHESSYTSTLGVAARLDDDWTFVDLLIGNANNHIDDDDKRRALISAAKRYSGRRVLEILATYRNDGASLREIIRLLWRWKWSVIHAPKAFRSLLLLVLPETMTDCLRGLKRDYVRKLGWKGSAQTSDS